MIPQCRGFIARCQKWPARSQGRVVRTTEAVIERATQQIDTLLANISQTEFVEA